MYNVKSAKILLVHPKWDVIFGTKTTVVVALNLLASFLYFFLYLSVLYFLNRREQKAFVNLYLSPLRGR